MACPGAGTRKSAPDFAQADGSISIRTEPTDLAAFLLDAYEGALLRARVEKSGAPLDRFIEVAFGRLLA